MQTLRQIRRMLQEERLTPRKRLGQSFLIDNNLLEKLLELAELRGDETVLEVGPGTGALTEALLERAGRVVAVEIDRGFCRLLRRRLGGREGLVLIEGDVLSSKHAIAEEVLSSVGGSGHLVSNLPYNIATPLVAECLKVSWSSLARRGAPGCRFDRLTFTVQREVAERLTATSGRAYGPISVIVSLLGRVRTGPAVPPEAFWPRPKVLSCMMRIDFDETAAGDLKDLDTLSAALSAAFAQRRKQIGSVAKRKDCPFRRGDFEAALQAAGVDPTQRAETVEPRKFLCLANTLAEAAANRPSRT